MKLKSTFLTTTFVAIIAISQPYNSFAHGEDEHHDEVSTHHEPAAQHHDALSTDHKHKEAHDSKAATSDQAFEEVATALSSLDGMVASGKLDGMHEEIEKTQASISTIKTKATVSGEKKSRLEAALKQLSAQLDKVHTASDKSDKAAAASDLKKAHGALKLVKANLN